MLIMTSIIRVGQSQFSLVPIDEDAQERILNCLQALAGMGASTSTKTIPSISFDEEMNGGATNGVDSTMNEVGEVESIKEIFLHDTQAAFTKMVAHEEKKKEEKRVKESKVVAIQADDLISFRQFAKKNSEGEVDEVSPCIPHSDDVY